MRLVVVLCLGLGCAIPAGAGIVLEMSTFPLAPTTHAPVILMVTYMDGCGSHLEASRSGFTVDVHLVSGEVCIPEPFPVTEALDLGLLPAGTYTVRFLADGLPPEVIGGFVVIQGSAEIPALGTTGSAALAVLLALAALSRLLAPRAGRRAFPPR